jgi:hypothetical protein
VPRRPQDKDAINRPRLPVQFGGVLIAETKLYGQLLHCLPGDSTYDIKMQLYSLQASGSLISLISP